MSHEYTRLVFDGEWYFNGWLCLRCHKQVSIEHAAEGPPDDMSECAVPEVQDEA